MPKGIPNLPTDALLSQHFAVEVAGVEIAQFSEFSGGATEVEIVEMKENNPQGQLIIHRQPGVRKPPTLTLKRALNASKDLYDWHRAALEGRVAESRKEGSITIKDFEGAEVSRWNFTGAWISKLTMGTLKAGSNELLTEEATVICETFERVS